MGSSPATHNFCRVCGDQLDQAVLFVSVFLCERADLFVCEVFECVSSCCVCYRASFLSLALCHNSSESAPAHSSPFNLFKDDRVDNIAWLADTGFVFMIFDQRKSFDFVSTCVL
jgi:hypothetical protein